MKNKTSGKIRNASGESRNEIEASNDPRVQIAGVSGKTSGRNLESDTFCAKTDQHHPAVNSDVVSDRVFPCRSNAEVRAALSSTLNLPKVHVEVAGGIVRHQSW